MITTGFKRKTEELPLDEQKLDWLESIILLGKKEKTVSRAQNGTFLTNQSVNQSAQNSELSLLLKCYEVRFKQLSKEKRRLNKEIRDCQKYIEIQNRTINNLKTRLYQYRNELNSDSSKKKPLSISKSTFHNLIISGLIFYAIYLLIQIM